jgi:heptosyltransferase-2
MNPMRILVVLPNWVGDVVLATPALRAIRRRYPDAFITFLCRRYVADVVAPSEWMDECIFWSSKPPSDARNPSWQQNLREAAGLWRLGGVLRQRRFDLVIVFANSFRSALAAWLSRAPRRVGYARDGRGWLLTERIEPLRDGKGFVPISMLDYYARLVECAGCSRESVGRAHPTLFCGPEDEAALEARLGPFDERPLVALNPGGAYGTAKLWPAERFAAVGDALAREYGARIVATGTPAERAIGERIVAAAREPVETYFDPPLGLGPLKALVRRAALLVTNDTGPRHFAVAFGVPVVTLFGPTDPRWTESHFPLERKVSLDLACQPCQEKLCPLGHTDCMNRLEPDAVIAAARDLLEARKHRAADATQSGINTRAIAR